MKSGCGYDHFEEMGPWLSSWRVTLDVKTQVSSSCCPVKSLHGAVPRLLWQIGTGVYSLLSGLASLEGGCLPQAEGMQAEQMEGPFKIHSVELKFEK